MIFISKKCVSIVTIVVLSMAVLGCTYEFPTPPEEDGGNLEEVDLSNPVFIGGTLFSGLQNGALTTNSVPNSIPQIFLSHLNDPNQQVNNSPNVNTLNGHNIYLNNDLSGQIGRYYLQYPKSDTVDFERFIRNGESFQYANQGDEIRNFSFPKAGLIDLTAANGNEFTRAFGYQNESIIDRAVSANPTFFMLNVGYEDLMAFASQGALGDANLASETNYTYGDLPTPGLFENKLDEILNEFLGSGSGVKGALLNIPDILKFPYFIEVYYDITPYINNTPLMPIVRNDANDYNNQLVAYYNANPGIPFDQRRPFLDFSGDIVGDWGILVEDTMLGDVFDENGSLVRPVRHAKRRELVFLPIEEQLGSNKGNRPINAIDKSNYLNEDDIELIRNRINAYNAIIRDKVDNSNGRLVMVDLFDYYEELFEGLNPILQRPAQGDLVEGVPYLPTVEVFGIFSADGINLNARGNALINKRIIESLNSAFTGSLRLVNPNDYSGIEILSSGQ